MGGVIFSKFLNKKTQNVIGECVKYIMKMKFNSGTQVLYILQLFSLLACLSPSSYGVIVVEMVVFSGWRWSPKHFPFFEGKIEIISLKFFPIFSPKSNLIFRTQENNPSNFPQTKQGQKES